MYGTYWCKYCNEQKKQFGDAFEHVDYVECDPQTEDSQAEKCVEDGIQGYPTWGFSDGTKLTGLRPFETLAETAGCEYTSEE